MEVPPDLRDAAERKLRKFEALLDDSGWIDVGFVEEQNPRIREKFHCEIVGHLKGRRIKVEGRAGEALSALEMAIERAERQIQRTRAKRRRFRKTAGTANHAVKAGAMPEPARPVTSVRPSPTSGLPVIVETRDADNKPMTPTEAAMQLDVLGESFLLFQNGDTGRPAVIYRRPDGDYGLMQAPK